MLLLIELKPRRFIHGVFGALARRGVGRKEGSLSAWPRSPRDTAGRGLPGKDFQRPKLLGPSYSLWSEPIQRRQLLSQDLGEQGGSGNAEESSSRYLPEHAHHRWQAVTSAVSIRSLAGNFLQKKLEHDGMLRSEKPFLGSCRFSLYQLSVEVYLFRRNSLTGFDLIDEDVNRLVSHVEFRDPDGRQGSRYIPR